MAERDNKNWVQKIAFNSIKRTVANKCSYLFQLPKRFYQKHPKLAICLAISTLFMGGSIAFAISHQQSALYFPDMGSGRRNDTNPQKLRHPSARELESEDLQIKTEDGVTLRGWHIKKNGSQRIIVYFHGNAGNIGTRLPFAEELMKRTNSDVIMVGYRGYSDSEGTPNQQGLEKDAEAIVKKALKIGEDAKKRVYVFGTSLGGAVTIYVSGRLSIRQRLAGVIVENTFTSTTEVLPFHAPWLKILVPLLTLVNKNSWNSLSRINQIIRPILFIKCGMDEVVPSYMTDKLREECNKHHIHNYCYELPNGRHNEVHIADPNSYFAQVNQFFAATS